MDKNRKLLAARYFRGVYSGDPAVVDELAADNIVASYPIFARLFDTAALRGRAAVKQFVRGFGSRWTEAEVTVHETIADGDRVVLLWSFSARRVAAEDTPPTAAGPTHAWGGITLFRFDAAGKIAAELGEESTPGPFARLIEAAGA